MRTGWYYMGTNWLRKTRRMGPISEHELLLRIDKGKIEPETLVQSSKTKGKWIPMKLIGPAMKRYRKLHPANEEQAVNP